MDVLGASWVELPPLSPVDHAWLDLHARPTWSHLAESFSRLLKTMPSVRDWQLAVVMDDRLRMLAARGETAETPVPRSMEDAFRASGCLRALVPAGVRYSIALRGPATAVGVVEITTEEDDFGLMARFNRHLEIAVQTIRANHELRIRTLRDETTGLFNARYLREALDRELKRGRRFGHPVSVLFVDLDRFKTVNDQYGHLVGTALLTEVAQRLDRSIRHIDSAYRYGGDEFVLLLVETSRDSAGIAAERIRKALAQPVFRTAEGQEIPVTVSMGIAAYPEDGDQVELLLAAADGALYRAKSSGRNEIVSTGDLAERDAHPPTA